MSKLPIGIDINNLIDDLRIVSWEASDILLYYSKILKSPGYAKEIIKTGKVSEKLNNIGYKCYDTEDFKIGYKSFLNKIKPKFKNK